MTQVVEAPSIIPKTVFLLDPKQIDQFWGDIIHILAEVPGYFDFFTAEWTYARAKSGDLQIWGLTDGQIRGFVVSQILVFPAQKAFEILGAGGPGTLHFMDEMEDVFEMIAEQAGCDNIIARIRPGLERILRKRNVIRHSVWVYRAVGKRKEH